MDCSPPGLSVHGIFQARVLEWGAIAFSKEGTHMPLYSTRRTRARNVCRLLARNLHISLMRRGHFYLYFSAFKWWSLDFNPGKHPGPFKNFFFYKTLFICFWLYWVFVAVHKLSLVAVSGGYSPLWYAGFLLRWLLLCRAWPLGSVASVKLWCVGSVVVAHRLSCPASCGILLDRGYWTHIPCTGRWIFNHWTIREVPDPGLLTFLIFYCYHCLGACLLLPWPRKPYEDRDCHDSFPKTTLAQGLAWPVF